MSIVSTKEHIEVRLHCIDVHMRTCLTKEHGEVVVAADDEDKAMARKIFEELDADQSGLLDLEEFGVLISRVGLDLAPPQATALFHEVLHDIPIRTSN